MFEAKTPLDFCSVCVHACSPGCRLCSELLNMPKTCPKTCNSRRKKAPIEFTICESFHDPSRAQIAYCKSKITGRLRFCRRHAKRTTGADPTASGAALPGKMFRPASAGPAAAAAGHSGFSDPATPPPGCDRPRPRAAPPATGDRSNRSSGNSAAARSSASAASTAPRLSPQRFRRRPHERNPIKTPGING